VRTTPLALLTLVAGCLSNLNQEKYFDRLAADAPHLAARVHEHREAIERTLTEKLSAEAPAEVEHIGLWGETWDVVRRPTDGEQIFMRGHMFHPDRAASNYYVAFTVAEDGTVEVIEQQVFAGGPS
jgi:outer membrane murein-binding lipoprotein Lpp